MPKKYNDMLILRLFNVLTISEKFPQRLISGASGVFPGTVTSIKAWRKWTFFKNIQCRNPRHNDYGAIADKKNSNTFLYFLQCLDTVQRLLTTRESTR